MKVGADLRNNLINSAALAVCVENGYETVVVADKASVVIVDSRQKVFDYLDRGKIVIQFLFADEIENTRYLLAFERFRNRLFVLHFLPGNPASTGWGLNGMLEVLAKIRLTENSVPQNPERSGSLLSRKRRDCGESREGK